jgi:hypothetical protein
MGTQKLDIKAYDTYRKKRNRILFFLTLPTIVLFVSFGILSGLDVVAFDLLMTIYFPLLIVNFLYIARMYPELTLYEMYTNYAAMVSEPRDTIPTRRPLFTTDWFEHFLTAGYSLAQDYQRYTMFYKYLKKLPGVANSTETLVFVIIAKHPSLDLFGEEIDQAIQSVYMTDTRFQRINKQIALQFKQYDRLDDTTREEADQAIVFHAGKQRLIHINVAYLKNTGSVYTICPAKRFPNKYVFYACQEIKRRAYLKEEE